MPKRSDFSVTLTGDDLPEFLRLVPMADVVTAVQRAMDDEEPSDEPIADVVARIVAEQTGVQIPARALRAVALPDHLRMRFAAVDERGSVVDKIGRAHV